MSAQAMSPQEKFLVREKFLAGFEKALEMALISCQSPEEAKAIILSGEKFVITSIASISGVPYSKKDRADMRGGSLDLWHTWCMKLQKVEHA